MTLEIKLKIGFFKTKRYCLNIEDKQIVMVPAEGDKSDRLVISEKDLRSVTIIGKSQTIELEIVTNQIIYMGTFTYLPSLDEVVKIFAYEFGGKLIFES